MSSQDKLSLVSEIVIDNPIYLELVGPFMWGVKGIGMSHDPKFGTALFPSTAYWCLLVMVPSYQAGNLRSSRILACLSQKKASKRLSSDPSPLQNHPSNSQNFSFNSHLQKLIRCSKPTGNIQPVSTSNCLSWVEAMVMTWFAAITKVLRCTQPLVPLSEVIICAVLLLYPLATWVNSQHVSLWVVWLGCFSMEIPFLKLLSWFTFKLIPQNAILVVHFESKNQGHRTSGTPEPLNSPRTHPEALAFPKKNIPERRLYILVCSKTTIKPP